MNKILYMWWTGASELSENRKNTIKIVQKNCGIDFTFLDKNSITEYELKEYKFHKAYEYLSDVHKSDYLRSYFMHHYGGAYSDIKISQTDWGYYFDILYNSEKNILGYTEECQDHIAVNQNDISKNNIKQSYYKLIGNGAFICKSNNKFTKLWIDKVNEKLDSAYDLLRENPATHPRDYNGFNINNKISSYPLRWAELQGEIFHKLCYDYNDLILHGLPKPIMYNYI